MQCFGGSFLFTLGSSDILYVKKPHHSTKTCHAKVETF